ncbi:hypothetical protein Tco_0606659 [Tanacetum coccineum]
MAIKMKGGSLFIEKKRGESNIVSCQGVTCLDHSHIMEIITTCGTVTNTQADTTLGGTCSCIWPLGPCHMTYPLRPGQCLSTSQRWSPGVIIASQKDKQRQHLRKDQSTSLPRLAEDQSPTEELHSSGLAYLYLNSAL